jgi:hypothetical protein
MILFLLLFNILYSANNNLLDRKEKDRTEKINTEIANKYLDALSCNNKNNNVQELRTKAENFLTSLNTHKDNKQYRNIASRIVDYIFDLQKSKPSITPLYIEYWNIPTSPTDVKIKDCSRIHRDDYSWMNRIVPAINIILIAYLSNNNTDLIAVIVALLIHIKMSKEKRCIDNDQKKSTRPRDENQDQVVAIAGILGIIIICFETMVDEETKKTDKALDSIIENIVKTCKEQSQTEKYDILKHDLRKEFMEPCNASSKILIIKFFYLALNTVFTKLLIDLIKQQNNYRTSIA